MRSGVKSRASMDVDTSIANTMSMPSEFTFSTSLEERGLARAMTSSAMAAVNSAIGRCRSTASAALPFRSHGAAMLTRRCGERPFICL